MTQSKLLTVEDVFDIPGRGLIVVPGPLVDSCMSPGLISVVLKCPNGHELVAIASIGFVHQTPPPTEHRFGVILKDVAKADVPIGTEIWFTNDNDTKRSEIEREADRLIAGLEKPGARQHVLAWLLFNANMPVDVRCPQCDDILTVEPFPNNGGATITCECGLCSGSMRGL